MADEIGELVEQARANVDAAGRHRAFAELVKRFQNMAVGCALGVLGDFQLAEDVAQDAFLSAYTGLAQLQDPSAFPGWFKQIVLRKAQRLQGRAPLVSLQAADMDIAAAGADQEKQIERRQTRELVRRAIERLPEHERLPTVLFYLSGYSQQKIAAFLELSQASVRKRLQRARNRLKERTLKMVEETFAEHRPSQDGKFTEQTVAMIEAAETGDLSKLAVLLSRNPALLDANAPLSDAYPVQAEGWKPLHIAAWHGRAQTVEFLLAEGAEINARCAGGRTPLHYAVEAGNQETRQLLLDKGAQVDIALAAILGRVDLVAEMLQAEPGLANDRSTGGVPLEWAAWGGDIEVARLLIGGGAGVDEPAVGFAAVATGDDALLGLLLDKGMDPNTHWQGRSLLHAAVEMHFSQDSIVIAGLLLERGAQINALDKAAKTPLDIALDKGGPGKFTLNPHETSNELREYDKIAAYLRQRGGERGKSHV